MNEQNKMKKCTEEKNFFLYTISAREKKGCELVRTAEEDRKWKGDEVQKENACNSKSVSSILS